METPAEKPKVPLTPCEEHGHFPEPVMEYGKAVEMQCRVCGRRMRDV